MHYTLNFVGYWTTTSVGIAAYPGIYCVCAGYSRTSIPLYIGEAADIESRIANHEKRFEWASVAQGQPLYFSFVRFSPAVDRRQPEAAMINYYKPPCNVEYVNNFPYPPTLITVKGPIVSLNGEFQVHPH